MHFWPYSVVSKPQCIPCEDTLVQKRKLGIVQLSCRSKTCDRALLRRWFATVASILDAADTDTFNLLQNYPSLKLMVSGKSAASVCLAWKVDAVNDTIKIRKNARKNVNNSVKPGKKSLSTIYTKSTLDTIATKKNSKSHCEKNNKESNVKTVLKVYDLEIPVIIGTLLWAACETLPVGSVLGFEELKYFHEQCLTLPINISCPTCCFVEYKPLGCFVLGGKLLRLPIFAFVDSSKVHVNRTTGDLTAYYNKQKLTIPEECKALKQRIYSTCDNFSNYSLHPAGKVFTKLAAEVAEAAFSVLKASHVTSESSKNGECDNAGSSEYDRNEPYLREPKLRSVAKAVHRKISARAAEIASNVTIGNVTEAISKRTFFKTTEMGGQSHETELLHGQNRDVSKTDTETRTGFFKPNSRYVTTPTNNPAILMFAPLHTAKLVSGTVLTNTHQSLATSAVGYVCCLHTVDNKNAGMHLELMPGTHFCGSYPADNCQLSTIVDCLLQRSKQMVAQNSTIEREIEACEQKIHTTGTTKADTTITLIDSQMRVYKLDGTQIPRMDLLVWSIATNCNSLHNAFPIEFFYDRKQHVGLFRCSYGTPLDTRYLLTPATREWLLDQYSEYWKQYLSPSIDNTVPICGVLASQITLPNHSSTNKLVAGLCGLRHACGLPVSVCISSEEYRNNAKIFNSSNCDNGDTNDTLNCLFSSNFIASVQKKFRSQYSDSELQESTKSKKNEDKSISGSTDTRVHGKQKYSEIIRSNQGKSGKCYFQPQKSLLYPQNDFLSSNGTQVCVPTQTAVIAVASFGSNNVEDGLAVNKQTRDRGFGLTLSSFNVTLNVTPDSAGIVKIAVPSDDTVCNAKLSVIAEIDIAQRKCSDLCGSGEVESAAKWNVNENCSSVSEENVNEDIVRRRNVAKQLPTTLTLPSSFRKQSFSQQDVLCDVTGVCKVRSFSTCLNTTIVQSACRVRYEDPYDTGALSSGLRRLKVSDVIVSGLSCNTNTRTLNSSNSSSANYNYSNNEFAITFIFQEVKHLEHGDKFSTLEGQKATVISILNAEDMPFFCSTDDRIPAVVDIVLNVSSQKRHTLNMFLGSNVRALKCAKPDDIDMKMLCTGDKSISHHNLASKDTKSCSVRDAVCNIIRKAKFLRSLPLCDGATGEYMGLADVFIGSFVRYEQEGNKTAYFAPDGNYVPRSLHGDTRVRGRGRFGGMKQSQSDTFNLIGHGSSLELFRQFQISAEPRLVHDRFTGVVAQSAASVFKVSAMHEVNIETEFEK